MCCAAIARSTPSWTAPKRIRGLRRSPIATARWCASSSRRCCAASAPCATCCGSSSTRGFPKDAPRVETVLLVGAAQILFLDVPDHAAVDLGVRLVQADRRAAQISRPDQCGAAPGRARRFGTDRRARSRAARYAVLAVRGAGSETTAPRRRARSPSRTGTSRRSISPSRRMPKAGRNDCADACCRPAACARSRRARSRCCPATTRARGGCRTPPPRCRHACSATSPASASPTSARRPAARPRSSRTPVPRSRPSTARPTGWRACARTSAGSASPPT